jgi:hypothetical protein
MDADLGSDRFATAWPRGHVEALYAEAREARRTAREMVRLSRELRERRISTQSWNHRLILDARLLQERRRANGQV